MCNTVVFMVDGITFVVNGMRLIVNAINCPNSYRMLDCKARFSFVLKGDYYERGEICLRHNHAFQLGNPWQYPQNRHLTEAEEAEVVSLMSVFKSTREIRRYISRKYGRVLTLDDIKTVTRRHRKRQAGEVCEVTELLEKNGTCRVVKEGGIIRYAFFVPSSMESIAARYCEVLLADATHQLNYGGYILWHCMLIDVTGIAYSFFYALLPDETVHSYRQAVDAMKEMLPSTALVQTLVIDKCMAQIGALKSAYPNAAVIFSRFHVMRDMYRRCAHLVGVGPGVRNILRQWLMFLIYTRDGEHFDRILRAIAEKSDELYRYVQLTWLPWASSWAAHRQRAVCLFGCASTNRVENENKYLKKKLTQQSSLKSLFTVIIERTSSLMQGRQMALGRYSATPYIPPVEFSLAASILIRFLPYARKQLLRHLRSAGITSLHDAGTHWVVDCTRGSKRRRYQVTADSCECEFHLQWRMPCAHLCHVTARKGLPMASIVTNCRWNAPCSRPVDVSPEAAGLSDVTFEEADDVLELRAMDRVTKLRKAEEVMTELKTQICSLGSTQYDAVLKSLKRFAELLSTHSDVSLYCTTQQCSEPFRLDQDDQYQRLMGSAGRNMVRYGFPNKETCMPSTSSVQHDGEASDIAGNLSSPGHIGNVGKTVYVGSAKRKSPIALRVTEVPTDSMPVPALKVRHISTTITSSGSKVDKTNRFARMTETSVSDVCAFCLREKDEASVGVAVPWLMCDVCGRWFHRTCAGYYGEEEFTCVYCEQ
ncbi:unnamed protein product [Dicrocoelium dendriticum]|nr:unnamed protein product [Dicrocoelium dendriticum]